MRIPLSPMDYYFFRRSLDTTQFVFEYQGHLNLQKFNKNIEKAINSFQAVSSRIKIISDFEIALETGYTVSAKSRSLEKEPALSSPDEIESFLEPIENVEGNPLVNILITYTPTRSFVGFSFSHMLGGGTSFFSFLNCLSKISFSEEFEGTPSNRRDLLQISRSNGTAQIKEQWFQVMIFSWPISQSGFTAKSHLIIINSSSAAR